MRKYDEFYKDKNVLVTGGTGLIGRPLLDLLLDEKAKITCVSLDNPKTDGKINFIKTVENFDNCRCLQGQDLVFNLVEVKGSLKCAKRGHSFYVPTIMFSINTVEAEDKQSRDICLQVVLGSIILGALTKMMFGQVFPRKHKFLVG